MSNSQLDYQRKYITKEEVKHFGDEKIFAVTRYYDLTKETEEDELRDIIEYDVDVIRELLFNKFKDIPRGEQYNKKMNEIFNYLKIC